MLARCCGYAQSGVTIQLLEQIRGELNSYNPTTIDIRQRLATAGVLIMADLAQTQISTEADLNHAINGVANRG